MYGNFAICFLFLSLKNVFACLFVKCRVMEMLKLLQKYFSSTKAKVRAIQFLIELYVKPSGNKMQF